MISGSDATGNRVRGNKIGTDVSGLASLANKDGGVLLFRSTLNSVGGTAAEARNVISGNDGYGVRVDLAAGNLIENNYIGLNINGVGGTGLGNAGSGVEVLGVSSDGATPGDPGQRHLRQFGRRGAPPRRILTDNTGKVIAEIATKHVLIAGNTIGLNAAGTDSVPAAAPSDGVHIYGSSGNTVGGAADGDRNFISGNAGSGMLVESTDADGHDADWQPYPEQLHRPGHQRRHGGAQRGQRRRGPRRGERRRHSLEIRGNVISGNSGDGCPPASHPD